jgi:acyl-CoA reductase-like NAD-dependent aldehyde dehydrogenase
MSDPVLSLLAPVIRFHAEDEALRIANDTPFGLAAGKAPVMASPTI